MQAIAPHEKTVPYQPQVMLSNGTLLTASPESNLDLLYAVAGGGPFYGLVLEWTLRLTPSPRELMVATFNWASANATLAAEVSYSICWQPSVMACLSFFASPSIRGKIGLHAPVPGYRRHLILAHSRPPTGDLRLLRHEAMGAARVSSLGGAHTGVSV